MGLLGTARADRLTVAAVLVLVALSIGIDLLRHLSTSPPRRRHRPEQAVQ
jgi:hypothetical protein